MIVRVFFGSRIGLAGGLMLLLITGALAFANDIFIMRGSDVIGVRSSALTWSLVGPIGLAALVMFASVVAIFVAWVGALLNTANLPSKNWCIALLIIGLLGFVFVATVAYVIAGPDRSAAPINADAGRQRSLRPGSARTVGSSDAVRL
jgi:hypothetical protein